MKKIVKIAIVLMPFLLFSCFEFVGTGTSKRMLNLALAAPGDVAKLHIGVFDSAVTPEKLLSKQSVAAGSSIPLDLPAGDNRIVVVWAEGYNGLANYYGSIGPIPIDENGNTPLPIHMKKFNAAAFTLSYSADTGLFTWNPIPGAYTFDIRYTLSYSCVITGGRPPETRDIIAIGSSAEMTIPSCWSLSASYTIRVMSSVFDLSSGWSN